jgi:hypothetical protein
MAEHLAVAEFQRRRTGSYFPEHKEFYFSFKRLMYGTNRGGRMSAALGENLCQEGSLYLPSYFVNQIGVIKMIFSL